ncbi:Inorganic pyrophosphatase [Vibrio stylophorae]|uniref:inorganic diphosphatase n=1 Tax=Vibrio stylophorae TaxID=659351 RepID=A0ABN8DTD2_9VIBR|nr:inorganic diphosphatase [Vibrio stylophorae]CAH0533828.1 Inorganic pyrophosphatase [Vibrio stylophorae]
MKKSIFTVCALLAFSGSASALEFKQIDTYTIQADRDYLADIDARNSSGHLNAIIEIPTGSNEKWEVSKQDGSIIHWEFKKGQPRIVHYLGYPGNYGTIPGTALPKALGGDGDPLDILVLGSAMPRGSVVSVRVIGAIQLLDNQEQDDKLIAIPLIEQSPFADVQSINDLEKQFPGTLDIVKLWFGHYKGPQGGMKIQGVMTAKEANQVLDQAIEHYQSAQKLAAHTSSTK